MTEIATADSIPLIEIRASSLPNQMDCARKWAYQMAQDPKLNFQPHFIKHGFEVKPRTSNNVGAAVGSACHEGFGQFFQAKIDGYSLESPEQVAIGKWRKQLKNSVEPVQFDDYKAGVTKDADAAEIQIKRMIAEYLPFAQTLKPRRVEFLLAVRPDELKPYLITGHPDIEETNDDVRDMKFGRSSSPYEAQLGMYSLMRRSAGADPGRLFVDWVPRNTINKPQKPRETIPYDIKTAENAAWHVSDNALNQLEKFIETGNPWSFPANNQGNLCSKKWCSAWGTPWCDLGRPEKPGETEE